MCINELSYTQNILFSLSYPLAFKLKNSIIEGVMNISTAINTNNTINIKFIYL